jgi:hypothetical protein
MDGCKIVRRHRPPRPIAIDDVLPTAHVRLLRVRTVGASIQTDECCPLPAKSAGELLDFSLNPIAVPEGKYRIGRSRTGLGLFAVKPYRKREYVATYRGRKLANAEAERLEARGSRYMFEVNSRWTIDGSSRWNYARYVNHSCRPNVEAIERRGGVIVYIARKKIKPDDEITTDYGKDYFEAFITKSRCQCEKCRERRAERQRGYRRKVKRALLRKKAMRKRSGIVGAKPASKIKANAKSRPQRKAKRSKKR